MKKHIYMRVCVNYNKKISKMRIFLNIFIFLLIVHDEFNDNNNNI